MGIQGLLPALKSIAVHTHVKHYAQQTLGVDAYVWLHRGAIACAWNLALGKPTTKYVEYAMHRIKMLQHYGVTPFVVFDGDFLPSKARTEKERAARRAESARLGREHMARGDNRMAQEFFQKAIDITPDMALRFIRALQANGIDYIVAPYEADAQLAYLERIGLIDGIITEDSDLLVFGCRKVLFKLNEYGECTEISRARFADNKDLSLVAWDDNMFRHMAILSGCDYLASVPGMGLKSAHRLVRRYKTLDRILRGLRVEAGLKMPVEYEDNFRKADMTFLHQRVFCPLKKSLVMGHEPMLPLDEETLLSIGDALTDEVAQAVASGAVDPITKKVILLSDPPGLRKLPSRFTNVPPAGNMLMDRFVQTGEKARPVLGERSVNEQIVLASPEAVAKRLAPRVSLREQEQAKKLKLFESSPSPPPQTIPESPVSKDEKENKISRFFAPRRTPKKIPPVDDDLAAAIRASMAEEARRQAFAGFENPVGFEVSCVATRAEPVNQTGTSSKHFPAAPAPVPHTPPVLLRHGSTESDSSRTMATTGLPTPPNSQNLEAVVAGWRRKYSCPEKTPMPPTTKKTLPCTPTTDPFRISSSISRIGGRALVRRSTSPNLSGSVHRTPFLPHTSSLSQPSTFPGSP